MTVDAIFAATLQLLAREGASRLTTTRVAERAGVSIGTMYQYFPNKQALLYALLEQHLAGVSQAMADAVQALEGHPLAAIADGLAAAWLRAKTGDLVASRALYAVAADFDITDLIDGHTARLEAAIAGVLAKAPDAPSRDLAAAAFTLVAVMGGAVRAAFERRDAERALDTLRAELPRVCRAYLETARDRYSHSIVPGGFDV